MAKKEIKDFEDLIVWQKSHNLVLEIYKQTENFPKQEQFGLVQQLRRSVASIPTNIAEGLGSNSNMNFKRMLYIGRGSLIETRYHLLLAKDLGYLSLEVYTNIRKDYDEVGRLLNGLINSLR